MKKKSNLLLRTVTGLVFIAVIIGVPLLGLDAFRVLFLIIACLTAAELVKLVRQSGAARLDTVSVSLLTVATCVTTSVIALGIDATAAACVTVMLFVITFISHLYRRDAHPVNELAYTVFVQAYAVLPFALIQFLAIEVDAFGSITYSPLLPLAMFTFIWANDTGAYCIGSAIGRTKLFPRISPHKTWEGTIGGVVVAMAAAYIFSICSDTFSAASPAANLAAWLGMALTVSVFGTYGDLVESMMKRAWGVKDSGNILPGHGGMLDRFDSTIFAIPATVAYVKIIETLLL